MVICPPQRVGRGGRRSKDGCVTCRIRKIKCDEARPLCGKCAQSKFSCEWNKATPSRKRQRQEYEKDKLSDATAILPSQAPPARLAPTSMNASATRIPEDNHSHIQSRGPVSVTSPNSSITSLQPALSTKHIPLTNSLLLEAEDWHLFQYIPNSILVLQFGKLWQWSMLCYVHTELASRHQGVMRAFIAVACMELNCRGLSGSSPTFTSLQTPNKADRLKDLAMRHYHRSLRDLSKLLSSISQSGPEDKDVDTIFSLWLLILQFSLYDANMVETSHVHISGIRSFIIQFFQDTCGTGRRSLPPASQQLLLFISYLDINFSLSKFGGSKPLATVVLDSPGSEITHERLFQEARVCLPKIWGDRYPASEVLDDMENYRGLSLLHTCLTLKTLVWDDIAIVSNGGTVSSEANLGLLRMIEGVGSKYTDVLHLAKSVSTSNGRRVIWTVYHAALEFHAVKILYSCIDSQDNSPTWLNTAVSELLAIAYKAMQEDTHQRYRLAPALSVALLKTRDHIHRSWIQGQLLRAKALYSTLSTGSLSTWPCESSHFLSMEPADAEILSLRSTLS